MARELGLLSRAALGGVKGFAEGNIKRIEAGEEDERLIKRADALSRIEEGRMGRLAEVTDGFERGRIVLKGGIDLTNQRLIESEAGARLRATIGAANLRHTQTIDSANFLAANASAERIENLIQGNLHATKIAEGTNELRKQLAETAADLANAQGRRTAEGQKRSDELAVKLAELNSAMRIKLQEITTAARSMDVETAAAASIFVAQLTTGSSEKQNTDRIASQERVVKLQIAGTLAAVEARTAGALDLEYEMQYGRENLAEINNAAAILMNTDRGTIALMTTNIQAYNTLNIAQMDDATRRKIAQLARQGSKDNAEIAATAGVEIARINQHIGPNSIPMEYWNSAAMPLNIKTAILTGLKTPSLKDQMSIATSYATGVAKSLNTFGDPSERPEVFVEAFERALSNQAAGIPFDYAAQITGTDEQGNNTYGMPHTEETYKALIQQQGSAAVAGDDESLRFDIHGDPSNVGNAPFPLKPDPARGVGHGANETEAAPTRQEDAAADAGGLSPFVKGDVIKGVGAGPGGRESQNWELFGDDGSKRRNWRRTDKPVTAR